ncbi:MAG: MBL fold metallo-hydrolase, partial [Bacteroidota bacterium]
MKKIILFILVAFLAPVIASSQTVSYEVYALKFAAAEHASPISVFAMNAPGNDSLKIFFMIWLVKGNNGKNILVDAGFLKDMEEAKNFGIVNFIRPDSMLFRVGLKPEDITDIILTHPHWDHIDGIDMFPNARVWIQKEDFNYFVGGAWQSGGNNWS